MANEITLTASLSCNKATSMAEAIGRSVTGALFSMTGSAPVQATMNVTTSATAVPLVSVVNPHWSYWHNCDTVNPVSISNGNNANNAFLTLLAGEYAFCPLATTCIPYATANTANVLLEYLICPL